MTVNLNGTHPAPPEPVLALATFDPGTIYTIDPPAAEGDSHSYNLLAGDVALQIDFRTIAADANRTIAKLVITTYRDRPAGDVTLATTIAVVVVEAQDIVG